jgi:hypothetical protein
MELGDPHESIHCITRLLANASSGLSKNGQQMTLAEDSVGAKEKIFHSISAQHQNK